MTEAKQAINLTSFRSIVSILNTFSNSNNDNDKNDNDNDNDQDYDKSLSIVSLVYIKTVRWIWWVNKDYVINHRHTLIPSLHPPPRPSSKKSLQSLSSRHYLTLSSLTWFTIYLVIQINFCCQLSWKCDTKDRY